MADDLKIRRLLVSFLALWYEVSQKQLALRTGRSEPGISQLLKRGVPSEDLLDQLLGAIPHRPAAVPLVAACLEGLAALDHNGDLTEDELLRIEEAAQAAARLAREVLTEEARLSRAGSREIKELCVDLCERSAQAASQDVEAAAVLARLAREVADRLGGTEGLRLQGFADAFGASVLRVTGALPEADAAIEEAESRWQAGTDADSVLDPGRLLDLKASLRRAQRRFDEALKLLDQAVEVGRSPERALIKKGFTLEVMGEYGRAVETLLEAEPLVLRRDDPRLLYMLRFNLAVNASHLGRYAEATELVQQARELAIRLGDQIFLSRITWMEGRVAGGLGRSDEARRLLAEARQGFASRGMTYDVALALLEEAVILLSEGQPEEVKTLSGELAAVFGSKGVHREALAALRLFQEAVEDQTATADLARCVLRYLFRARHDQGLPFTNS